MMVEVNSENEKLIKDKLRSGAFPSLDDLIHRALVSLPTPQGEIKPHNNNLAEFLMNSPFAGADLDLERRKQFLRPAGR